MRVFPADAEVATGLDLALLGILATVLGGYIRNISTVPIESFSGVYEITLIRAAAVIPTAIGSMIFFAGLTVAVGGPFLCWFGWPLYWRLSS